MTSGTAFRHKASADLVVLLKHPRAPGDESRIARAVKRHAACGIHSTTGGHCPTCKLAPGPDGLLFHHLVDARLDVRRTAEPIARMLGTPGPASSRKRGAR